MIFWTIKAHKAKYYISLITAVSLIAAVFILFPKDNTDYLYPDDILPTVLTISQKDFRGISSNEDRIAFLAKYGWEVEKEPKEIREVTVPREFDSVYEQYNQMQLSEGLDLKKVAGK